jgi:ATP-binding cassette subfamily G (WHITE) protein 2 (PDR)
MSLVGNFTSNGDRQTAHTVPSPDAVPPPQYPVAGTGRVGSDTSESSTIAAKDDTRLHPHAHNDPTSTKESNYTTTQNSEDGDSVGRREEQVHALARRYTEQSTNSTSQQSPFAATPGSALDPNGGNFSARAWAKAMLHTQQEDPNAPPIRTAGVSFSNMNVHGFGSDTDYQKSVGNVWLEGPGLFRKIKGDKGRKIEILQHLDGLVEAGEMLVVLGPPGSGCSTFLKTIAGETHGFFVDEASKTNYQGASTKDCNRNSLANGEQESAHNRWPRTSVVKPSILPKSTFIFPC